MYKVLEPTYKKTRPQIKLKRGRKKKKVNNLVMVTKSHYFTFSEKINTINYKLSHMAMGKYLLNYDIGNKDDHISDKSVTSMLTLTYRGKGSVT